MRSLSLILLLLLSFSCSKKEEKTVVAKTGLELVALGSVNYGGVLLNQYKDAAIRIINHDASSVNLDLTIPEPFSVVSKSVSCAGNILGPQSECIISIRFAPQVEGEFELNLKIGESSLPLRGVGLEDGYVLIDTSSWELGSVKAGTLLFKDITFTNLGDLSVQTPAFSLPPYLRFGFNKCGSFIPARASCQIRFEATLEQAQEYDEIIRGYSEDSGSVEFNLTASVYPGEPSGMITFSTAPTTMGSAGEEKTLISNPIKDAYGNIVTPGTIVSVSVNNILLLLDGNTYPTDNNGRISFRVRTRTIKGSGAVSVLASQASGYVNFPVTAGAAYGTINIPSVMNEIPANGNSQVILSTQIIYDQYNNIVEDGTEVIFELLGNGEVNSGANKKIRVTYTINGVATVTVKAGIVAEQALLKVYSTPIYDQLGTIVGYGASGSVNLNFVPGPADGVIPVLPSVPAIYSSTNPPGDIIPLPTKSRVTIGPVKDKFGNIVKENTQVSVRITNGFSSSGALPSNNVVLTTDNLGYATFDLIGESKRGEITVSATAALASGSAKVWAYLKSALNYVQGTGTVSLYYKHHDATEPPSANLRWAPVAKVETIATLDGSYYGLSKDSDSPKDVFNNLPYYTWQCFFPALDNLVSNFCLKPSGELSPLMVYSADHHASYDLPATNPQPELNPNVTFPSDKQLQNWTYMKPGTDSAPKWTQLSSTDGGLLIDNQVALNSEQINDGLRKRQAYSVWIDVDWTKQYVVNYTVREQLGYTDERALEVGVVESTSTDPAIIDDPNYDLVPLITKYQENVYLAASNNPENFKFIYIPKQNVKKIRLYFSTKGRGNSARVIYDNISIKRVDTGNIHDHLVTEGASAHYMPLLDQIVMFGGSTLIEEQGPVYFPATSDRNTLMTKILDKSSSIIVENFIPGSGPIELGDVPSGRAHAPMASDYNDKVYMFGGFSPSSNSAYNDLYVFNSSLRAWSELDVLPDLTVPGALQEPEMGKPSPRYQHGLTFVPELNRLYLVGGIRQDSETESVWYNNDDVWYIALNQSPLTWKRVCDMCGGLTGALYSNLTDALIRLGNVPNAANYNNYVTAARNIKRINLIWHSASQKLYVHVPESDIVKIFDPFTETYDAPPAKGLAEMKTGFQLTYIPEIGRTFSYRRGDVASNNSRLTYWDMNRDEKQYLKVRFALGQGAKLHTQEFAMKIYAYGKSVTTRPTGVDKTSGVSTYVYNYTQNQWVSLANHSSDTSTSVPQLFRKINDATVRNYVSPDGYVEVLITPRGRPGIDGGAELMGNDLEFVNAGVDYQGNLLTVKQVVTSENSTCILLDNGRIKCWGQNRNGELGHNTYTEVYGQNPGTMGNDLPETKLFDPNLPINAGLIINKIFMGGQHACALFNNGKAKCWGNNAWGQLGYPNNVGGQNLVVGESLPFLDVGTLDSTANTVSSEIVDLALGDKHTCALVKAYGLPTASPEIREQTLQNRIKCWGNYRNGQVGSSTATINALPSDHRSTFLNEPGLILKGRATPFLTIPNIMDPIISQNRPKKALSLKAGSQHTCALLEDNSIVCWGLNSSGQLGHNSTAKSEVPAGVVFPHTSLAPVSILSAGGNHTCIVFDVSGAKNLKCWGANQFGQLGLGDTTNRGATANQMTDLPAVSLPTGLYPVSLSLGLYHTCALFNNARMACWGYNAQGQLGIGLANGNVGAAPGTMGNNLSFVNLGTDTGGSNGQPIEVISMSGYDSHNCAVTSDRLLKCFGENEFSQLGYEDSIVRGRALDSGAGVNEIKLDFIQMEVVY